MDEEWVEYAFEEVIDFQEGPGILAKDFRLEGVPLVRLAGLDEDGSILKKCNFLDPEMVARRWSHFRLRAGDTLLSTSASLGRTKLVDAAGAGAIPYTGIIRMRPRDARVRTEYIRYVLQGEDFQTQARAMGSGSVITHFGPSHLRSMTLKVPRPDEQLAIAAFLANIDERIKRHRRMAETLEEMARALFRSWFVDFDPVRAKADGRDTGLPVELADLFPDRFVDSALGEIPAGWVAVSLGDRVRNFDSRRVPLSGAQRAVRQGAYPYHGATGVMDHVDDYLFDGAYVLVGEDGSVIRPGTTRAFTQYVVGRFWVNNHAHVLTGRDHISTEFLHLFFEHASVAPFVTGAVQAKLSQGRMNSIPFVDPDPSVCAAFDAQVQPLYARSVAAKAATATLEKLRVALLPKLVSGEVRIGDPVGFLERLEAVG